MSFCSNCGKQTAEEATFCNNCGTKVQQGNPETAVNDEQEKGARLVLACSKKEGFLKMATCYIVFYDDELVLAHISKEKYKVETERFRQELKEQGKGFLKSTIAMFGFWNNYGNKYYSMHKQLILEEDPRNCAIGYQTVKKLIFRTVNNVSVSENSGSTTGELVLKTMTGKTKFTHSYHDSNKKIKGILSALFGKALKYRGGGFTITIGGNKDAIS